MSELLEADQLTTTRNKLVVTRLCMLECQKNAVCTGEIAIDEVCCHVSRAISMIFVAGARQASYCASQTGGLGCSLRT